MDFNDILSKATSSLASSMGGSDATYTGEASNGLVKVTINNEMKVLNVDINESIINKEDKEMIEELIVIAFNNALDKYTSKSAEAMSSLFGQLGVK